MISIHKTARLAGIFYLIFIITLIASSAVRSRLIVSGDAGATAHNLIVSGRMFRAGIVIELISAVFFLLAAWALYGLLKPVDKNLALLFLLLNLGGVVVESMNMNNLLAALLTLGGAGVGAGNPAAQLQSQAMLYLNLYTNGFMIAQVFYGTWLLPLGYLVFISGFLPKILGVLLMLDCFGVLIWFFQFFFFPGYEAFTYPGLAISFIAEFSLSLWLLMKGVKDQKPVLVPVG